jgi:tryptophanyl-tRNA synthetase
LYSLVADESQREAMAAMYRRGGFGYGEVKKALADAAEKFFGEPRARRAELASNPKHIRDILGDGAAKARKKAVAVLKRAQDASGIRGW